MSVPPQKPYRFSKRELTVCVVLLAGIAFIYSSLVHADFINLDDFEYVKYNVHLARGFDWDAVKWAFTPGYASNWHPLTWFSHLLDRWLFGLDPAWHHLENVCFHGANSVLLFFILTRLTNRFWESAVVAALFAWHPLHVESVAWISERKDVLSTFLILLCVWMYARYVSAQTSTRWQGRGRYVASLCFFALALMAKPMSVTVPFVLLLLDYWPLGRWLRPADDPAVVQPGMRRILLEKVPFFVMTAAACVLTMKAQTRAMTSLQDLPLWARLANAVASYAAYLRKMIWPTDLSILYPLAEVPWRTVAISAVVVGMTIGVAIYAARRRPYVTFGCCWFFGMLVPTIGLVQVGAQSFADRYTYLPLVGIFIGIVWWVGDVMTQQRLRSGMLAATIAVLASYAVCARYETGYWRNSIRLFTHGLKNTTNNFFLVSGMASILDDSDIPGISKESAFYYYWAFLLNPKDTKLNYNYGNFWARRGAYDKALTYYDNAIAIRPDYAEAYFDRANTLSILNRFSEAETNFVRALQLDPGYVNAEVNLAGLLAIRHRYEEAISHYNRALALAPHYAKAHHLMGVTLGRMGNMEGAFEHFRLAVQYFDYPDPTVWNDYAWMLAVMPQPSLHNPDEAVRFAQKACELSNYSEAAFLDTLAVAYAQQGKFDEAAKTTEKVIEIAKAKDRTSLVAEMERRRSLYLKRQPYWPETITEERPVKSMLDLSPRK